MTADTAAPASTAPPPAPRGALPERWLAALTGWPLTLGVGLWCAALVAGWLPHYLTWPWYVDEDHFLSVARRWDAGMLPYRDTVCFQFPGAVYEFWLVGRVFGWANSPAYYALDAAAVAGFGLLLAAWSRREFGRTLPGLVGFSTFLAYYLSQDFRATAQRDWHASFLCACALLTPVLRPGRGGRALSGALFGLAVVFRPQMVLLAPGLLASACRPGPAPPARPRLRAARAGLAWGAAAAAVVGLGLLPLVRAGVLGDFLENLRLVRGGDYNRVTAARVGLRLLKLCAYQPGVVFAPLLTFALGGRSGAGGRTARAFLAALAGAALYGPVSPMNHSYLQFPVVVTLAVGYALVAGLILRAGAGPALGFSALLLLVLAGRAPSGGLPRFVMTPWTDVYQEPHFSTFKEAAYPLDEAVRCLRAGRLPAARPPGVSENTSWADLRAVILYLRDETPADARVATLLHSMTGVTAMSGRVPALPVDEWTLFFFPRLQDRDVAVIERRGADAVVWNPARFDDDQPRLRALSAAIRRSYRPQKRFGAVEVWAPAGVP